jgi:pimeloyl-ACP methyl ester carboxylesterase
MDYGSNMQHYATIQAHFRASRTPVLLLWGERDQYLSIDAAHAYEHDLQKPELCILDGGHWLLESHFSEVNEAVQKFISTHVS